MTWSRFHLFAVVFAIAYGTFLLYNLIRTPEPTPVELVHQQVEELYQEAEHKMAVVDTMVAMSSDGEVYVYKADQPELITDDRNGGGTPDPVEEEPIPYEPTVEKEPRLIDDIIRLLQTLSPFLVPIITYFFARRERKQKDKPVTV